MNVAVILEKTSSNDAALFTVRVRGNFYNGYMYEQGVDSILVLATSSVEAMKIAKGNVNAIETHFREKRYDGSLAISKNDKSNMTKKNILRAKHTNNQKWYKTLTTSGMFVNVEL